MAHENEHPLHLRLFRLHTPNAALIGREFRVEDWADRIPVSQRRDGLNERFRQRLQLKLRELPEFLCFDFWTHPKLVFGYLGDDQSNPFLVHDDEILSPGRILHKAHDKTFEWLASRAGELQGVTEKMYSACFANATGGESDKERLASLQFCNLGLNTVMKTLACYMAPGPFLLDEEWGMRQLDRALSQMEQVWEHTERLSALIHEQYQQQVGDFVIDHGWLKDEGFHQLMGSTEAQLRHEPTEVLVRACVVDTLAGFMKDLLTYRNALVAAGKKVTRQFDLLTAFHKGDAGVIKRMGGLPDQLEQFKKVTA